MKSILPLCAALAAQVLPLCGQGGPLTPPPGAPAPGMRSLDQIEPRIPLVTGAPGVSIAGAGTISISAPGSYHLTGNLTVTAGAGIIISANGVSVDLRGFTISSTAATASAFGVNILGSTSPSPTAISSAARSTMPAAVGTNSPGRDSPTASMPGPPASGTSASATSRCRAAT